MCNYANTQRPGCDGGDDDDDDDDDEICLV